jgi:hypothetical protein
MQLHVFDMQKTANRDNCERIFRLNRISDLSERGKRVSIAFNQPQRDAVANKLLFQYLRHICETIQGNCITYTEASGGKVLPTSGDNSFVFKERILASLIVVHPI